MALRTDSIYSKPRPEKNMTTLWLCVKKDGQYKPGDHIYYLPKGVWQAKSWIPASLRTCRKPKITVDHKAPFEIPASEYDKNFNGKVIGKYSTVNPYLLQKVGTVNSELNNKPSQYKIGDRIWYQNKPTGNWENAWVLIYDGKQV